MQPHTVNKPIAISRSGADRGFETAAVQSLEAEIDYEATFKAAGSPATACQHVAAGLQKKLFKILSLPEEDIDLQKPMHRFDASV